MACVAATYDTLLLANPDNPWWMTGIRAAVILADGWFLLEVDRLGSWVRR